MRTVGGRAGRLAAAGAVTLALVAGGCGSDGPTAGPDPGPGVDGRAPTTEGGSGTPTTAPPGATGTRPPAQAPLGDVAATLTPVAEVDAPTKLVARPGSDVLYVAEQAGTVVMLAPDGDGLAHRGPALDLTAVTRSGGERGLLGLAFSPDGATLYVHHSGPDGETRVAAFAMDGDRADAGSRVDLLTVEQPFANHNGGDLLVDADGHLWIALGDGGAGGDPDDRAQDADDLLGKVLRVDPARPGGGRPYGIPADNPWADGAGGRPEVVVTGVRNPWRIRFDRETGDLWVADVGQNAWEEIDRLPAGAVLGANLGWAAFEGSEPYRDGTEVRNGPAIGPVFEMSHDDGWCSVTGGPVYRGSAVPGLAGAYLFGDFCKPGLNALRLGPDGTMAETAVLDGDVAQVVSIDEDGAGEVYVLSLSGTISRLDPAP